MLRACIDCSCCRQQLKSQIPQTRAQLRSELVRRGCFWRSSRYGDRWGGSWCSCCCPRRLNRISRHRSDEVSAALFLNRRLLQCIVFTANAGVFSLLAFCSAQCKQCGPEKKSANDTNCFVIVCGFIKATAKLGDACRQSVVFCRDLLAVIRLVLHGGCVRWCNVF